ncbi:hypothetical protein ABH313_23930, partial [Chromobacterium vaccinii]|uniref:hypothetical protein n=1 Tax=Chromobacterium vaccinii TaxID=1108595 RepID=UPI00326035BB
DSNFLHFAQLARRAWHQMLCGVIARQQICVAREAEAMSFRMETGMAMHADARSICQLQSGFLFSSY